MDSLRATCRWGGGGGGGESPWLGPASKLGTRLNEGAGEGAREPKLDWCGGGAGEGARELKLSWCGGGAGEGARELKLS